jgi:hypothetical protein
MSVVDAGTTASQDRPQAKKRRRPRSAVTSGRRLLIGGDPNSAWSRRYSDLVKRHVADLGGRGTLSQAQLSLVRRAAALACELEQMEARMSAGVEVNLDSFGRAASHLRRLLESLGLKRQPRTVNELTLDEINAEYWERSLDDSAA